MKLTKQQQLMLIASLLLLTPADGQQEPADDQQETHEPPRALSLAYAIAIGSAAVLVTPYADIVFVHPTYPLTNRGYFWATTILTAGITAFLLAAYVIYPGLRGEKAEDEVHLATIYFDTAVLGSLIDIGVYCFMRLIQIYLTTPSQSNLQHPLMGSTENGEMEQLGAAGVAENQNTSICSRLFRPFTTERSESANVNQSYSVS